MRVVQLPNNELYESSSKYIYVCVTCNSIQEYNVNMDKRYKCKRCGSKRAWKMLPYDIEPTKHFVFRYCEFCGSVSEFTMLPEYPAAVCSECGNPAESFFLYQHKELISND